MTDHPSTFNATETHHEGVQWDDRAALHRADDGQGLLDGGKGLRDGTLADMVHHVMMLPEEDQEKYVIQKKGDHQLTISEIRALAAREDYPRK